MPVVQPQPFRHIFEESDERIIITLPSHRTGVDILFGIFGLIFLLIWIVALLIFVLMIFGEELVRVILTLTFAHEMDTDSILAYACLSVVVTPFIFLQLLILAKGLHSSLWTLFGKEIIEIDPKSICIHLKLFNFNRPRDISIANIRRIRPQPIDRFRLGFWKTLASTPEENLGIIALELDKKTFRFGNDIEEVEAKQILRQIKKHFPVYPIDWE